MDMIVLFNRMTGEDCLSDSSWENIIDYHYEKFRLIYNSLRLAGLNDDFMYMGLRENRTSLSIDMEFKSKKLAKEFSYALDNILYDNRFNGGKFSLVKSLDKARINITITNTKDIDEVMLCYELVSNSNG